MVNTGSHDAVKYQSPGGFHPPCAQRHQEIGYRGARAGGFDANSCAVLVALDQQSPDIAQGG